MNPTLTSPGTLYYFTHEADTEASYISGPLQAKLDLDRAYVREASVVYDLRLAFQTIRALARVAGKRR